MASAARVTPFSPEEYLAMDCTAEFKSEYDGDSITPWRVRVGPITESALEHRQCGQLSAQGPSVRSVHE